MYRRILVILLAVGLLGTFVIPEKFAFGNEDEIAEEVVAADEAGGEPPAPPVDPPPAEQPPAEQARPDSGDDQQKDLTDLATLTINHLLISEDGDDVEVEELIETESFEVEIGTEVIAADYVNEYTGFSFSSLESLSITMAEEGASLDIYYTEAELTESIFPAPAEGGLLTVTFAPGVEGAFLPVVHNNLSPGSPTPAPPVPIGNGGWKFAGWSPGVAPTVTNNVTYTAGWYQITGDKFDATLILHGENSR